MKRLKHLFSFVLILLFTYLAFKSLLPPKISGPEAPLTEFSTARALEHLKVISEKPHYVGTQAHGEVRDYIITALEKMGLEPQVQEGFIYEEWRGYGSLVKPKNILARIKGTGEGKAVLLMSHYDSAPHSSSHGASDAGSGVVTILEGVRAYLARGKQPKNDIIICITDAEELGLYGAELFVNEHPWAKDVGVALNFEARGSGGPSNMIVETNGGNANLIKGFKEAGVQYPVATSLMYSIYKMLPNDTDSTILREDGDIDGFFFAFIDDHFHYHTINDTYENLDRETLEHQGSYLMPLLDYYAQADLSTIKTSDDDVYFDTAIATFISYPFSWIWPMVGIACILFILLLASGVRRGVLSGALIGRGFAVFLATLVLGTVLLYALWALIKVLYPAYEELLPVFIYNGHWYIAAFVALGVSFCFGMYYRFTKPEQTPSLMVAPLAVWLLINILMAIYLPGAAYFIIPVYFGLLAFFVMTRQQRPSNTLMALLCAPALFIFAPLVQFFPVGLGPDMLFVSVLFLILLFGLLLPVFGVYRAKKWLSYIGIILGIGFLSMAHAKSSAAPDRQAPNSLVYYQNADAGKAFWATYDEHPDTWVKSYIGNEPLNAKEHIGNAAGSKYNAPYTYAKETTAIDLPAPYICIEKDTILNDSRHVTLVIAPRRKVDQLRLYSDLDTPFQSMRFNGKVFPPDSTATTYKRRGSKGLLHYYVSDRDSLEFSFSVPVGVSPNFTLKEFSLDLLANPQFTVAARPMETMPKQFVVNDAVITERSFNLSAFAKAQKDTLSID